MWPPCFPSLWQQELLQFLAAKNCQSRKLFSKIILLMDKILHQLIFKKYIESLVFMHLSQSDKHFLVATAALTFMSMSQEFHLNTLSLPCPCHIPVHYTNIISQGHSLIKTLSRNFTNWSFPKLLQEPSQPSSHVLGSFHCLTALHAFVQAPTELLLLSNLVSEASIWKAIVERIAIAAKIWKTMG